MSVSVLKSNNMFTKGDSGTTSYFIRLEDADCLKRKTISRTIGDATRRKNYCTNTTRTIIVVE